MTLADGGHLCDDCELEAAMRHGVRGAFNKQMGTAIPAALPAISLLVHALIRGAEPQLYALGFIAGGLAGLHALYSLDAFLTQERLPMRPVTAKRYDALVVATVMALLGTLAGSIHLFAML